MLTATLAAVVTSHSSRLASAATQTLSPSMGTIAGRPPSAQEIALDNQKQQLVREYLCMLQGKEPLGVFQQHMMALLKQRGLAYSARLPQVMERIKLGPAGCPVVFGPMGCPSTGGGQFPEHPKYYCGPAAASTVLVTDSFLWGSAVLTYDGYRLIDDDQVVSPPSYY